MTIANVNNITSQNNAASKNNNKKQTNKPKIICIIFYNIPMFSPGVFVAKTGLSTQMEYFLSNC